MGTQTVTPVLPNPDDAYAAFKIANGAYQSAMASQTQAVSAASLADAAVVTANSNVTQTASGLQAASVTLVASVEAFEATLPTSAGS